MLLFVKNVEQIFCAEMCRGRPYHPQSLGCLERFNKGFHTWEKDLPEANNCDELTLLRYLYVYNNRRHRVTKEKPVVRYLCVCTLHRLYASPPSSWEYPSTVQTPEEMSDLLKSQYDIPVLEAKFPIHGLVIHEVFVYCKVFCF